MTPCRVLLIPALFFLYAAAPVAGQTTVSVLAGVTSARLKAAGADDYKHCGPPRLCPDGSRTGVSLGATVTVPVDPNLGIRLGVAYVQKGASIGVRADDILNAFYADLKLDYIELSALAKASVPGSGGLLYLLAGPTVSFEVRCTTDLTYSLGGDTVESQLGRDYSDVPCSERDYGIGAANTEAVEFAVAGGIGTEFPAGASIRVSVDLLYTLGLVSVLGDSRNRAITLRAGVSLPIR